MGRRPRSVQDCRTAGDFVSVVTREGGRIDNGGRHYKARRGDGTGCVPIPRHNGDLATGTRHSIIKALLALGFMALVFACLAGMIKLPDVSAGGIPEPTPTVNWLATECP